MRRGWLFKDTKGAIWQWLRKDGALEGVFHAERQSDGYCSTFCGTAAFEVISEPCPHLAQDDIDPVLYGLPQDSEIGPEVYPAPAREYQEGEAVEVLFPDGWRSGATFTGYRAGEPDEDFLRINVKLAEPGRSAEGCHPDCVRRPFEREARP